MSTDFWNSRYAESGYAYGTEPNAFLVAQKKYLKPGGKALAVADGEGRNGVWLAQQGLNVKPDTRPAGTWLPAGALRHPPCRAGLSDIG